jgi:hypothetical protein
MMKTMTTRFGMLVAALGLMAGAPGTASSADINILWYEGGVTSDTSNFATYQAALNSLVAAAPSAPGGNTWTITPWNSGAMPTGSFNVLVVASPEGPWTTGPSYSALQAAFALPSFTLGNRVMLTGQDADWHYQNFPGPASFNGPGGFLLDAINWAGSGTGLGAVILGIGSNGALGVTLPGETETFGVTNNVQIPSAFASFPINTDLTSAGLSNWNTAAHTTFTIQDPSLWTGINVDGDVPSQYVTIVSTPTAGGGISGSVPEPSTATMLLTAGSMVLFAVRRRAAKG